MYKRDIKASMGVTSKCYCNCNPLLIQFPADCSQINQNWTFVHICADKSVPTPSKTHTLINTTKKLSLTHATQKKTKKKTHNVPSQSFSLALQTSKESVPRSLSSSAWSFNSSSVTIPHTSSLPDHPWCPSFHIPSPSQPSYSLTHATSFTRAQDEDLQILSFCLWAFTPCCLIPCISSELVM